jgi:ABC-type nitrate/sulfonate/bicarbonate transport system permease component
MKRYELLGCILLIAVWEVFSRLSQNFFFPSVELIYNEAVTNIRYDEVWRNLSTTIIKTLICFFTGNICGVLVGILISFSKKMVSISTFTIDFMRSLPPIVIFPLFMIVFGINDLTQILVTSFGIFWIVLFNTIQSIDSISKVKIKYLKIHGSSSWDIIRHYIIFVLFKNWLTIFKVNLNLSLFITIVLEMFIGSENGIGKAIIHTKNYYEINQMYFWIIVAGTIGYILNKIMVFIEKRIDF